MEKVLLQKLNTLKSIQPDQGWVLTNRETLSSQISASARLPRPLSISERLIKISVSVKNLVVQPTFIAVSVFILALGAIGVRASFTRPGDSLYIAKIISEKTQLAFTFNQEAKTRKEIQFANNHARQITQMLAEDSNQSKTNELAADFKKEINIVKNKISNIKITNLGVVADKNIAASSTDNSSEVFSANVSKDQNGIEISSAEENVDTASSSPADSSTTAPTTIEPDKILQEAENLFDQKDYAGASDKLKQVDDLLNQDTATETDATAPAPETEIATDTASTTN